MGWKIADLVPAAALMRSSRSTVLHTLSWLMVVLTTGLVALVLAKAETWIQIFFAVMLLTAFGAYINSYYFFREKDPDALRSERFGIDKLAISHGVYGDSDRGVLEGEYEEVPPEITATKTLEQPRRRPRSKSGGEK